MIEGHPRFGDERGLLFDVDEDPGERRNLRATDAEEFEALAARADRYEGRLEPRPPVHQQTGLPIDLEAEAPGLVRPLEPEMREQLRELGYLD